MSVVVSSTERILRTVIRLLGLGLLLYGMWTLSRVCVELLDVLVGGQTIIRLSEAIEQSSHIDSALQSIWPGRANDISKSPDLARLVSFVLAPTVLLLIAIVGLQATWTGGKMLLRRSPKLPSRRRPKGQKNR